MTYMTPAENAAWERQQERYAKRRRWLRSEGIPARPSDGDPGRPSMRPAALRERRRLSYLRAKARRLGITLAQAARITPRRPRPHLRGRNAHVPRRDAAGRFLPGLSRRAAVLRISGR